MIKVERSKSAAAIVGEATSAMHRVYVNFQPMLMVLEDALGAVGFDLQQHRCQFIKGLLDKPEAGKGDVLEAVEDGPFRPFRVTHARPSNRQK